MASILSCTKQRRRTIIGMQSYCNIYGTLILCNRYNFVHYEWTLIPLIITEITQILKLSPFSLWRAANSPFYTSPSFKIILGQEKNIRTELNGYPLILGYLLITRLSSYLQSVLCWHLCNVSTEIFSKLILILVINVNCWYCI